MEFKEVIGDLNFKNVDVIGFIDSHLTTEAWWGIV